MHAEDNGDRRSPNRLTPSSPARVIITATHLLRVGVVSWPGFPNAPKRSPWRDTKTFPTDWRCRRCFLYFGHTLFMEVYNPAVLGAHCNAWVVSGVCVIISASISVLFCILAWSRGQSWGSRRVLSCDGGDVIPRQRQGSSEIGPGAEIVESFDPRSSRPRPNVKGDP